MSCWVQVFPWPSFPVLLSTSTRPLSRQVILGPRIAVGGFAEVFAATYAGTPVAVKRLIAESGAVLVIVLVFVAVAAAS